MNLDKLDEALTKLGPLVDNRACIDGFKEVFEAARAFRDRERARQPKSPTIEECEAAHARWARGETIELHEANRLHPRVTGLLVALRTEVVPALERAADDRKPGIYSSESLKLLTALGLR